MFVLSVCERVIPYEGFCTVIYAATMRTCYTCLYSWLTFMDIILSYYNHVFVQLTQEHCTDLLFMYICTVTHRGCGWLSVCWFFRTDGGIVTLCHRQGCESWTGSVDSCLTVKQYAGPNAAKRHYGQEINKDSWTLFLSVKHMFLLYPPPPIHNKVRGRRYTWITMFVCLSFCATSFVQKISCEPLNLL